MPTTSIPLTLTPVGATVSITGGNSIGLTDQVGVTEIPSFTGIPGTATLTITPTAPGCLSQSITIDITVLESVVSASIQSFPNDFNPLLPFFTFKTSGLDENNTNGGVGRATFYLQSYAGGKADWGDGLIQAITTGDNTHSYTNNDPKEILVYNLPVVSNYIAFNSGSGNVTDFNIDNMLNISVGIRGEAMTSLSQINNSNLVDLWFQNTPIVFTGDMFDFIPKLHGLEIDNLVTGVFPNLTGKDYFEIFYAFTSINFTPPLINPLFKTTGLDYEIENAGLTQAQVDAILVHLDTLTIIDSDTYIDLLNNTAPSAIGLVAKNAMILDGAYIDTD
jgi:hypothetical protein